ncbi:MAG TPA: DPP IV N-terminal domain-containing protein, partial [bacterium]|nr:DPP IV N-terminal domain-containing protein [bacterium]
SYNLGLQTKNQLYGALSPDMTKLAFSAEPKTSMPVTGRQLWLKELTGLKRLFQLTFTEGDCNDVQFVDDNHIVFRHKNQSFENYYLISINGTDLTNLTNTETGIYSSRLGRPTLNQSRCVIAYAKQGQSAEGYSNWEIHQLNLQTMAETQILTGMYFSEEQPIDQYDPQPAFIEDSSIDTPLVVFVGKEPFSAVNSLYITAVHSNNPYSIKIPESEGATYPIFYPFVAKPVKFIYTLSPDLTDQIYLMDSSNQSLQLTSTINSNKDPVLDISGSIIAYAGNGIWKAKADGTDAVQIDTDYYAGYPAISPDGMWIAYVKSNDIYVRKTDLSGSAIRLTHSSSTGKMELCFEPSGSAILYTCDEDGPQIFSLPINISSNTITVTGEPVNLTKKPGSANYQPSYSPDGKKIIFISNRTNAPAIYTMNPDGSAVQQISFQSQPIMPCYPQFSPWQNDSRISFIAQQQYKYINIINIANLETGNITQVSPSISPTGKFSWGKDIKNNVSVKRQLPYNRIDGNLPYYYFLDISVNPLNPPSTFIITEELPTISKGACANWKITGVWFNDIPIFPLTSNGNTTGTVKWVVGSIFPLTDGILKLKIEFDGGTVINGSWNFINGNVVDGSMKNMISGDSYTVFASQTVLLIQMATMKFLIVNYFSR